MDLQVNVPFRNAAWHCPVRLRFISLCFYYNAYDYASFWERRGFECMAADRDQREPLCVCFFFCCCCFSLECCVEGNAYEQSRPASSITIRLRTIPRTLVFFSGSVHQCRLDRLPFWLCTQFRVCAPRARLVNTPNRQERTRLSIDFCRARTSDQEQHVLESDLKLQPHVFHIAAGFRKSQAGVLGSVAATLTRDTPSGFFFFLYLSSIPPDGRISIADDTHSFIPRRSRERRAGNEADAAGFGKEMHVAV